MIDVLNQCDRQVGDFVAAARWLNEGFLVSRLNVEWVTKNWYLWVDTERRIVIDNDSQFNSCGNRRFIPRIEELLENDFVRVVPRELVWCLVCKGPVRTSKTQDKCGARSFKCDACSNEGTSPYFVIATSI